MTGGAQTKSLIKLADYAPPELPTDEWLKLRWKQFRALVTSSDQRPMVAEDQLEPATLATLDQVVAPPACGTVVEEIAATIAAREEEALPSTRLTLIVNPPCDENDVVGTWAAQNGHDVLEPPPRDEVMGSAEVPSLSGDGLLVLPGLERWALRHTDGLGMIRALLAALDASERRVVIGCSSWGWSFLSHAVSSDLILPEPITFAPFDADRLSDWLSDLGGTGDGQMRFRLTSTGEDILQGEQSAHDFFQNLAAISRGIPWVAWHLWRQALRSQDDTQDVDGPASHQTLWVAALNEMVLPGHHPQVALLVLHALLIHGPLSREQLEQVVPVDGRGMIVASLVHSGFVERDGAQIRMRTAAYPSVRSGLKSAGFPVDAL